MTSILGLCPLVNAVDAVLYVIDALRNQTVTQGLYESFSSVQDSCPSMKSSATSLRRTSALRACITTSVSHHHRSWSTFGRLREDGRSSSALRRQPAPPRLPKEEQDVFERLQRSSLARAAGSSPPASTREPDQASTKVVSSSTSNPMSENAPRTEDDQAPHPDARRGAKPEFEGDINPGTGEVGGPKNDPLRWGSTGEWTYNGRATDF